MMLKINLNKVPKILKDVDYGRVEVEFKIMKMHNEKKFKKFQTCNSKKGEKNITCCIICRLVNGARLARKF